MTWALTGVAYTSMKEPGGIADAIAALRECGLAEELRSLGVKDAGDLRLEEPRGERGPSGVLNEPALVRLVQATHARVVDAHRAGRRPLLVGGDCPVLLGALAAVRQLCSAPALLMLDGHEDAWPPALSPTGEGSDSEVAIALGRVADLPRPLSGLLPLLEPSAIAFLGPRDRDELATAGLESLRDQVAFYADDIETSAALRAGQDPAAAALEAMAADSFWLHIDLDALRTEALGAVDYRQPGGLAWDELDRLAATAANATGCRGASVVIYNPDLDPNRVDARKIVAFLSRLMAASAEANHGGAGRRP
jgi:arginase